MDDQLAQWFADASGFSAVDLSTFIRMLAFFLTAIFGGIVVKGMLKEVSEGDNPMVLLSRLCVLLIFMTAMQAVLYI